MKKITMPVLSLIMAYLTVDIMKIILELAPFNYLLLSIFIAWALNLLVTGTFAFTSFAYPIYNLLPSSYFRIKDARWLNKIYNILGVKYFKSLLMLMHWGKRKNRKSYFNGTKSGIESLVNKSKNAETGHILPFLILTLISVYFLLLKFYSLAISVLVINFIGNYYPVLLQRNHRMRIDRILNKNNR